VLGANPMASNGSLMTAPDIRGRLKAIRDRGGRVIVLDPRRTETAERADRHIFIRPGTDAVLLLAMVHELFASGLVRLGRLASSIKGEPERHHIVSRSNAYHGTHGIGTSILGMPYREGFGPLLADTSQVEWDSAVALEEEIQRVGPDRVAAFVFEPVIGAGGVHVPPPGYLDEAVAVCRRHGVLVIADCVIAGFGRLGGWLGVERFHLHPDLITFAKGVTSGYLPLGGVIVAPEVAAPFWDEPGQMFAHGATYSGHATCCAAALANLDVLARDDLVHRAMELEADFHATLSELTSHPLMGEVRGGLGLMAGVALDLGAIDDDPSLPGRFTSAARDAGVATRGLRDGLAIAPPLIIELEQVAEIRDRLAAALDTL